MEATTLVRKDYFEWIDAGDTEYGDKQLLNEAAATIDKYLTTNPKAGQFLIDAVDFLLQGYGNNIADAPYHYESMVEEIFLILSDPDVTPILNKKGLAFHSSNLKRLLLLREFFNSLQKEHKVKAEILLNDFKQNPDSYNPEELISEYETRTHLAAIGKS
ncbi:MAG: hypothetical protein ACO1OO_08595 [Flavisolibacter sp.]